MKVVIIKHENSGQMYLFKVPQDYALFAGELVLVETKNKGNQLGRCLCDSFEMPKNQDAKNEIFKAFRISSDPCSSVIGVYRLTEFTQKEYTNNTLTKKDIRDYEYIAKEHAKKIIDKHDCPYCRDTHDGSVGICFLLSSLNRACPNKSDVDERCNAFNCPIISERNEFRA